MGFRDLRENTSFRMGSRSLFHSFSPLVVPLPGALCSDLPTESNFRHHQPTSSFGRAQGFHCTRAAGIAAPLVCTSKLCLWNMGDDDGDPRVLDTG